MRNVSRPHLLTVCMLLSMSIRSGAVFGQQSELPAFVAPKSYVCYRTPSDITIDGKLTDDAWQHAAWTSDFVDIEGERQPKPRFRTRVKMLWGDRALYIAAELQEPHVWGALTTRDSVIFHDNDFEVFLDPNGDHHNYGELEVNALNTVWDLRLPRPYRFGGTADDGWTIEDLQTAVDVSGTLNDPADTDTAWTVEISIPWKGLRALDEAATPIRAARREGSVFREYSEPVIPTVDTAYTSVPAASQPPKNGEQWRVNFSRVEWHHEIQDGRYRRIPDSREDNWVWSPQGKIDMHAPETWGYVQFSTKPVIDAKKSPAILRADRAARAKHLLQSVCLAQLEYRQQHSKYALTMDTLGLSGLTHPSLASPIRLEASETDFRAWAEIRSSSGSVERWTIFSDSRLEHSVL
jgi:hypothetical protein